MTKAVSQSFEKLVVDFNGMLIYLSNYLMIVKEFFKTELVIRAK